MNNNEKYPNGYLPKIEFWEAKYIMALEAGINWYRRGNSIKGNEYHLLAKEAEKKVAYFRMREEGNVSKGVWN